MNILGSDKSLFFFEDVPPKQIHVWGSLRLLLEQWKRVDLLKAIHVKRDQKVSHHQKLYKNIGYGVELTSRDLVEASHCVSENRVYNAR